MRRALLACVASGLLLAFALPQAFPWLSLREIDPDGHLEVLAWFGLVPALLALDRAGSARRALGLGLVAGLAYFYLAIWWVNHAMTAFGGVPVPVALLGLSLLVLFMAAHWAGAFAVAFTIRQRLGWPLWTHLPFVWAAFELLRNYLFSGFPWAHLGYLQARHQLVPQLAALTGVYGVAALVVLVNAALAAAVAARLERRPLPRRALGVAVAALALTLAHGALHLRAVRARMAAAPRLRVALVQGNVNQEVKNQGRRYAEKILERYVPLTAEGDRQGADLVLWPEAAYPFLLPPDLERFDDPRIGLPPLARAHLLLGVPTFREAIGPGGERVLTGANTVQLLTPDLRVIGRYAKHHLVPFGEYVPAFLAGVLRSVVPTMVQQKPGGALRALELETPDGRKVRLAPMICFDAIFPEVNVAFARERPDLLVNPTNDAWYGYSSGPYQFLALVRMRAIEAGQALVRPAYAGVSALIDPTGEVQPGALPVGPVDPELAPDPEEGPRLLVGEVPLLPPGTLYTRYGDLFAWAAAAFTVIAFVAARSPLAARLARRGGAPQGPTAERRDATSD